MKGFKLYFYDNNEQLILLTDYTDGNNTSLTFNENITENENSQFSLNFSITASIASTLRFPASLNLIYYLRIGRKLRLEFENYSNTSDDNYNYIDMIISSISPEGKPDNIIYNITAVDYFNYVASKSNVGLVLDTIEDGEWLEQELDSNILNIGNYLLRRANLQKINSYTSSQDVLFQEADGEYDQIQNWQSKQIQSNKDNVLTFTFYDDRFTTTIGAPCILFVNSSNVNTGIFIDNYCEVEIENNSSTWIDLEYHHYMGDWVIKRYKFTLLNNILTYQIFVKDIIKNPVEISADRLKNMELLLDIDLITLDYEIPVYDTNSWKIVKDSTSVVLNQKLNLSVSDSNTMNGLIELANLSESLIFINYYYKTITYIYKIDAIFDKHYQLSPNFNLQNFSLNYSGDELYPILYVQGGVNEYDEIVSLIPYIPYSTLRFLKEITIDPYEGIANPFDIDLTGGIPINYYSNLWESSTWQTYLADTDPTSEEYIDTINFIRIADKIPYIDSFLLNFIYLYNAGLITLAQYNELLEYYYNDLRKVNIKLQHINNRKNNIEYNIFELESKINSLSDLIIAEDNENIEENKSNFLKIFFNPSYDDVISGVKTLAEITAMPVANFISLDFPAVFNVNGVVRTTTNTGVLNWLGNQQIVYAANHWIEFEKYEGQFTWTGKGTFTYSIRKKVFIGERYWEELDSLTFLPDATFSTLPDPNTNTSLRTGMTIYVSGNQKYYWLHQRNIQQSDTNYTTTITLVNAKVTYYGTDSNLLELYPLFENYNRYGGIDYINKKYNYYRQSLIDLIQEKKSIIAEIDNLNNQIAIASSTPTSDLYVDLTTRLAKAQEDLESYQAATGSWGYDECNDEFIDYTIKYENINYTVSGADASIVTGIHILPGEVDVDTKTIYPNRIMILTNLINMDQNTFRVDIGNKYTSRSSAFPNGFSAEYGCYYYLWVPTSFTLDDGDWNDCYYDGIENYGKYCYIVKFFEDYKNQYILHPNYYDYTNNVLTQYAATKTEKDNLLYEIKDNYGKYLYEGYYTNDIETDPLRLYEQAVKNSVNYQKPAEQYGMSYLDLSNVIGRDINAIKVGDRIEILNTNLGIFSESQGNIQVISISKDLRSDITQLTVNYIQSVDTLVQKIISNTNKTVQNIIIGTKVASREKIRRDGGYVPYSVKDIK